ncbi:MAG TPA: DivIVA domain-containing protein [Gaiellaceae bacterium]|jgi:DivIVA domain-containing protein|nr:DivIVA domain-containing protein [Gaiellaceae bacterium]
METPDFYRRLAEHARLAFVDDDALSAIDTPMLTEEARRYFGVVPIADDGETLVLATADPVNADTTALAALTAREIRLAVATPEAIARAAAAPAPPAPPAPAPAVPATPSPAPASTLPAAAPTMHAMTEFRRSFRGYRRAEVDVFVATAAAAAGRMQQELDAANARSAAMLVEIKDLHERVDRLREREESVTRQLDELRDRREQHERDARRQAQELVQEAQERAVLLKSEGLRQVGELQSQVEQLIGMRAGLTQALQRLGEDLAAAMARLASSPATGIDRPIEHHVERWQHEER